jgi:aspartate kinase
MISTSEVKVSCVIEKENIETAISALCKSFDIDSSSVLSSESTESSQSPAVRGVALDPDQARLAIRHIPDHPGMAAKVFGLLSQENISVDMIIQSQRCRVVNGIPTRDIAFTVAQDCAIAAKNVLEEITPLLVDGEISVDTNIAKVSIVGAGMIGQPGVAAKFFEALANNKINISMIATSEIKISCVVDQNQGEMALKAVHSAFELGGENQIKVEA